MGEEHMTSWKQRCRISLGRVLLATLVIALLMGSIPTAQAVDTEKPYVVRFTPANGQGGVEIDTVMSVDFSEDVRSTNLDSHITLKDGRGFLVAKRLDYSNLTFRAIITPMEPLKYSMMYIISVSTFIQDQAGNSLQMPVQWTFNTTKEKVPPTVTSVSPTHNSKDVGINSTIKVWFSEEMDIDSLRTGLVVHDSLENPVIGNTTPAPDGLTVSFEPLFTFGYGEFYTVTVLQTVKDQAGNLMTSDFTFSFRVQLEQIPPRVVNLEPIDQSQFVSKDTKITVKFSEPMNSTSLAGSVTIVDPSLEEVPTTPGYNADNYTLIIKPDQALDFQTLYTVTVRTVAQDLAGNLLDKEYYTTFTTEPLPQQPPRIESRTPPEDRFNWYEGIAATFQIDASDPNDDILVYTWLVNSEIREGETFNEFNFYPEPGSAGSYKIEVEIFDGVTAPVKHFWIIDVVASGPSNGNGPKTEDFNWASMWLVGIIAAVAGVLAFGYMHLMNRRSEILARTRLRLRPLKFKRAGPPKPPSYEEMYLRQDGVYNKISPEFKAQAPPGGPITKTQASAEAEIDGVVMGEAPQLVRASEVEIMDTTEGPYTTAAPELAKTRAPGALICPNCGKKAIEAAHGRVWCDTCGFVE
jgi:methionine-rich copper-binding protein CopC